MKRQLLKTMLALVLIVLGGVNVMALETYDFQELCMKLGKGGPWAVNDGGDAGFTLGTEEAPIVMHYLGDYTDQGFSWNQRFAYEYVDGRNKFTMRNKKNTKDSNCGMFSWDYSHKFSILDLKDGDKVTITTLAGTTTFVSTNVTAEVNEGDVVASGTAYTISTTDETTRLDIEMAEATLIAKIQIEPYGVETVPVITVTPKTLKLIPDATAKLSVSVSPAMTTQWSSSDESVATIAEDGTVKAIAAGTATITNSWKSEISDATASDACVITVADIDMSQYMIVRAYDFTTMGDVTLTVQEEAAGAIWNAANSKNNNVFFCTNEGLEQIAVQAVEDKNKGWSITTKGLFLASGAGRCAAVGGIKKGQVVEILYTGTGFYTKSDGSDDGIAKTALNEGVGRAIYLADADGMVGFELDKGNAVTQINIYSNPKETLQKVVAVAKMLGIDTTDAEAVLANGGATAEEIAAAMQSLFGELQQKAGDMVAMLKDFFNQFDATAATALAPYFTAAETALAGTDFDAMREATTVLAAKCLEEGKSAMEKVDTYLRKMENETINADLDAIKAAIAGIKEPNEILSLISVVKQLKDDMSGAVTAYLKEVGALITNDNNAGKDVSALNTVYTNTVATAFSYASGSATLVEMGTALYNLIKAVEDYKAADKSYKFVASEWPAGDPGRISAENVVVDAEANTITVSQTGQNNVALIFRSANTYEVKAAERYFVIKATGLSTVSGASYLWWLNNTNNGSQIEPTDIYEEDGQTVFAWDCATIAIGGQLGLQDTEFSDQGGWSTTFGMTLADETVPAVISFIGFQEAIQNPVEEYEYAFVASEWPAGDPGRISASNVVVDEVNNTITVDATGDNNVALNFKTDKVYYITQPVKYFVIQAKGLSTEEGKSYLWWLNAKNNGGQVAPTSIKTDEAGLTTFAWDITANATFASGFNAEGKSYLDGTGASTWGWTTTFGLTLADASVPAVISYIGYEPENSDIVTAISTAKAAPAANGTVYNMAGQRVEKAQKGLFIVNGKLVVKK